MAGGKEGSVAPKERINVKYVPATGDQQEEVELPLRLMMLGNFTGRPDETPVEERQVLSVDKNSFNTILEDTNIEREITVQNTLTDEEDAELTANIKIKSLSDFAPDSIVQQVPELKSLGDLREALVALKGPLGNIPAFRKRLEQLLQDDEAREKLLGELEASNVADAEAMDEAEANEAAGDDSPSPSED